MIYSYIARAPFAIQRLTGEITTKIIFLEKKQAMKVFNTALATNILLLLSDVSRVFKYGLDGITPLTFSKIISLVALGTATYAYTEGVSDISDIVQNSKSRKQSKRNSVKEPREELQKDLIEEEDKIQEVVNEDVVEENILDEDDFIVKNEDGTVTDINTLPEVDDEELIDISRKILTGSDFPDQFKEVSNDTLLSPGIQNSFHIEKDFIDFSSEESIEEITKSMYESSSVEFTKEDESISFDSLQSMLGNI